jgi:hypothetical protein
MVKKFVLFQREAKLMMISHYEIDCPPGPSSQQMHLL